MLLLKIVLSFMKITLLAFGGAYAAIPLVENEVVQVQGWMTVAEFANLIAIDELTPGPIIINCATFVGMHVAGVPGAIAATLGVILPAGTLAMILLMLYRKYKEMPLLDNIIQTLKCMAIAMILTTFLNIAFNALFGSRTIDLSNTNYLAVVLIPISFYLLRKYKPNPLYIMLGCGAINLAFHLIAG